MQSLITIAIKTTTIIKNRLYRCLQRHHNYGGQHHFHHQYHHCYLCQKSHRHHQHHDDDDDDDDDYDYDDDYNGGNDDGYCDNDDSSHETIHILQIIISIHILCFIQVLKMPPKLRKKYELNLGKRTAIERFLGEKTLPEIKEGWRRCDGTWGKLCMFIYKKYDHQLQKMLYQKFKDFEPRKTRTSNPGPEEFINFTEGDSKTFVRGNDLDDVQQDSSKPDDITFAKFSQSDSEVMYRITKQSGNHEQNSRHASPGIFENGLENCGNQMVQDQPGQAKDHRCSIKMDSDESLTMNHPREHEDLAATDVAEVTQSRNNTFELDISSLVSDNHSLHLKLDNSYTEPLMTSTPQRMNDVPGNSSKLNPNITDKNSTSNSTTSEGSERFIADYNQETIDTCDPNKHSTVGNFIPEKEVIAKGINKRHPNSNSSRRREKSKFLI